MSNYAKHMTMVREKLGAVINAYQNKLNSVIGDEAIKVVEQLVEADVARQDVHMYKHIDRHQHINKEYPVDIQSATKKVWYAYKDLGYDGLNGNKAKFVVQNLKKILAYFEERLNERIIPENYPDVD